MKLPKNIIIETTNDCNMFCKGCYREIGDVHTHENMNLDTFKEILAKVQAREPGYKPNIVPFSHGEAHMNPEYTQILEHLVANDYSFCYSTNGKRYTDAIDTTLRSNNRVFFSLDGYSHGVQDYWREKYSTSRELHILEAIDARNDCGKGQVGVTYLRQGQDWRDVMDFVAGWIKDGADLVIIRHWLSSEKEQGNPLVEECKYWKSDRRSEYLVIKTTGEVLLCERNMNAPAIGNIFDDSIEELLGRQVQHKVCDGCQQRYNGTSMTGTVYIYDLARLYWKQDYFNQMFSRKSENLY